MLEEKVIKKIRKLNNDNDYNSASVFKALSDVNRYRIFRILAEHPKIAVSSLAKILHISTPLTSIHLKVLFQAKLICKEKVGNIVYSKLNMENPLVRGIIHAIILDK